MTCPGCREALVVGEVVDHGNIRLRRLRCPSCGRSFESEEVVARELFRGGSAFLVGNHEGGPKA